MGKAISITLPNGRFWSKKSDAKAHFRAILGRYTVGQRVEDALDHEDLAALLKVYDLDLPSGAPTKAGVGVAYFEKRPDMDHPGTTACFFVVRTDGSSIDFSLRHALDAASKTSTPNHTSVGTV